MKATRIVGMAILLAGLGSAVARAQGTSADKVSPGDTSPEGILKSRGLTLENKKYFVLVKEESALMAELNKVLPLVDNLDLMFAQWSANEQKKFMVQAMTAEISATEANIQYIQQNMGNLDRNPVVAKYQRQEAQANLNALRTYRNNVESERNAVRRSIASVLVQQDHLNKVAKAREVFLKAFDDMGPTISRVKAAYDALQQDDQVANALKVLRQSKSIAFKLGPSEGLQRAMGRVNMAKDTLDPAHFKPKGYNSKRPGKKK